MNEKYILDTNIIHFLEAEKLEERKDTINYNYDNKLNIERNNILISILSICEFESSKTASDNDKIVQDLQEAENFLYNKVARITISGNTPAYYAKIRYLYKKTYGGTSKSLGKHDIDFLIAATALEFDLVVVSNDKIFNRIRKILPEVFKWEDWSSMRDGIECVYESINTEKITEYIQKGFSINPQHFSTLQTFHLE